MLLIKHSKCKQFYPKQVAEGPESNCHHFVSIFFKLEISNLDVQGDSLMKQVPGVINTPGDPTRLFDSCQVTNNAKRIGATCYKYNERVNTHFFVCVKTPQFNGGLSLPIPWIKGYFISSSKNQIVCSPYLSIISLLPLERSISSNWFYQGLQAISSTFALP